MAGICDCGGQYEVIEANGTKRNYCPACGTFEKGRFTPKPTSYEDEVAYEKRTRELKREQAGYELMVHIRRCIEGKLSERRWKGNAIPKELEMYFKDGTPPALRNGELHRQMTIEARTVDDKILLIRTILDPHVRAGNIPAYTLEEIVVHGKPCLLLRCPIAI